MKQKYNTRFCLLLLIGFILVVASGCKKEIPQYTLDVSVNPEGSGTVSLSPGGGTYPEGTEVTLAPSAYSAKKFLKWGGPDVSSVTGNKVVMWKNMALAANFETLFANGQWHGHYANLVPIKSDILFNLSDNKITKVGSSLMSSDGSLCSMIVYIYFTNVTISSYYFTDIPLTNGQFNYSGSNITITGVFTSDNSCAGSVAYSNNSNRASYTYVATSLADPPTLTTTLISGITQTTATGGGNITDDGGLTVTARGVCWSTTTNPTIANNRTTNGTGAGAYTSSITGLTSNTLYYVRAYSTNSSGTYYGNQLNFTTGLAFVSTSAPKDITMSSATLGGNVTSEGGSAVYERGVVYAITQNPTIENTKVPNGTGAGSYSSTISGLAANTTYFTRAYAINNQGTAYGNQFILKTFNSSTVTDIDGNVYYTVTIGSQVWMAENLKTTKYNDGTSIPLVTGDIQWNALSTPGYCWYNNDAATFKSTYGALYNWYAVNVLSNGGKNVCPAGWHVPTYAEWTMLMTYLGGENIAGGKLKETGTAHWVEPNTGATNESGFTALPGGLHAGSYGYIGNSGHWWSSTEHPNDNVYAGDMGLNYYVTYATQSYYGSKNLGYSVRCLRD
jgi:uncharacterized protein (TIGR02145 family)